MFRHLPRSRVSDPHSPHLNCGEWTENAWLAKIGNLDSKLSNILAHTCKRNGEKNNNNKNQTLTWWESSALWLLLLLFVVHQFLHSFASMAVGVVSIGPLLDLTLGPSLSTVTSMDELVLVHVVNVCFVETVLNEITRHCASLKIKIR